MRYERLLSILSEKYLRSEALFAFELEACMRVPRTAVDIEDDHQRAAETQRAFDKLIPQFRSTWGRYVKDGKDADFKDDESIEPDEPEDLTFEYASPAVPMTPANLTKLNRFLQGLKTVEVYTNDTCGFHVHASFPRMTEEDMAWVTVNLSVDGEGQKLARGITPDMTDKSDTSYLELLQGKYEDRSYAGTKYLRYIRDALVRYIDAKQANNVGTMDHELDVIAGQLDATKRRVLRMHPQGTLEWRGPRNFIDDKESISAFLTDLVKFVDWMRTAQERKTINAGAKVVDGRPVAITVDRATLFDDMRKATTQPGHKLNLDIVRKGGTLSMFTNETPKETAVAALRAYPWLRELRIQKDSPGDGIYAYQTGGELRFMTRSAISGEWRDGVMTHLYAVRGGRNNGTLRVTGGVIVNATEASGIVIDGGTIAMKLFTFAGPNTFIPERLWNIKLLSGRMVITAREQTALSVVEELVAGGISCKIDDPITSIERVIAGETADAKLVRVTIRDEAHGERLSQILRS